MQSNLPAGSAKDPRAPWNYEDLCPYCDIDVIRDIADQEATNSDRNYDEVLEAMLEDTCMCKDCFKEQEADSYDDWNNWNS
jgi:hypothetical protein